jgi:serine/threonine protein kinase
MPLVQFVQKQDFSPAETAKAQQQISFFNLKAVLIGALRSNSVFYPVVLAGKSLKLLKVSNSINDKRLSAEYLKSSYERLNKILPSAEQIEILQKDNSVAVLRDYQEKCLDAELHDKSLTEENKLSIFKTITGQLDIIHRQGLAHGHICSGNILLDKSGQAIITDYCLGFFISDKRETFAPESAKTLTPDKAADLYGLGLILQDLFPSGTEIVPAHLQRDLLSPNKLKRPTTAALLEELNSLKKPVAKNIPTTNKEPVVERKSIQSSNLYFIIGLLLFTAIAYNILTPGREEESVSTDSVEPLKTENNIDKVRSAISGAAREGLEAGPEKDKIIASLDGMLSVEFDAENIKLLLNAISSEKDVLLIFKLLTGFYSEDLKKLESIYSIIPQIRHLQKYYDWFAMNPLADWSKENYLVKLLIIAGDVSNNISNPDLYFDLIYFPQPEISAKAARVIVNKKSTLKLLIDSIRNNPEIKRVPAISLYFACALEKKKQRHLISKWFDYQPDVKSVYNLLMDFDRHSEYEVFSFFAGRYLKSVKFSPTDEQVLKMLSHSEDQVRIFAVNEISNNRKKLIPALKLALDKEQNPKIKEAIQLITGGK